jgi:hypothetical protein
LDLGPVELKTAQRVNPDPVKLKTAQLLDLGPVELKTAQLMDLDPVKLQAAHSTLLFCLVDSTVSLQAKAPNLKRFGEHDDKNNFFKFVAH